MTTATSHPTLGTLHILGRDGGDTCGQPDCGRPCCDLPQHQVRTVLLRITCGDGDAIDGSALLCRDAVNGGWVPMGPSVDCWLSGEIMDHGARTGTLEQIVEACRDWRVRSVALEVLS